MHLLALNAHFQMVRERRQNKSSGRSCLFFCVAYLILVAAAALISYSIHVYGPWPDYLLHNYVFYPLMDGLFALDLFEAAMLLALYVFFFKLTPAGGAGGAGGADS